MSAQSSDQGLSRANSLSTGSSEFLVAVSRIMLGWLFLTAGWGKITNIAGTAAYFAGLHMPGAEFGPYIIGSIELLIAIMLIFGLATRYAAFVTFVFLVIATAMAHRYWEYAAAARGAQFINFSKNIAIMSGALLLFVTGGGRYSIDAALGR